MISTVVVVLHFLPIPCWQGVPARWIRGSARQAPGLIVWPTRGNRTLSPESVPAVPPTRQDRIRGRGRSVRLRARTGPGAPAGGHLPASLPTPLTYFLNSKLSQKVINCWLCTLTLDVASSRDSGYKIHAVPRKLLSQLDIRSHLGNKKLFEPTSPRAETSLFSE